MESSRWDLSNSRLNISLSSNTCKIRKSSLYFPTQNKIKNSPNQVFSRESLIKGDIMFVLPFHTREKPWELVRILFIYGVSLLTPMKSRRIIRYPFWPTGCGRPSPPPSPTWSPPTINASTFPFYGHTTPHIPPRSCGTARSPQRPSLSHSCDEFDCLQLHLEAALFFVSRSICLLTLRLYFGHSENELLFWECFLPVLGGGHSIAP